MSPEERGDDNNDGIVPHVQYMVACENVTFDVAQNISLQGIFDNLNALGFPTLTAQFFVVFGLHRVKPGTYRSRIVIEDDDGETILNQALNETAIPPPNNSARIILRLNQFVWTKPGRYSIKLEMDDRPVDAFFLDVRNAVGSQFQTINEANN
jgi:hypothetical protein